MKKSITSRISEGEVLCVILGGWAGSRLFPLTKERSKPAVPLGGKYRLVDVPISNCIHSGFKRIYVLTQFNSASLHRHISQSYKFDPFGGGFVEILAAEQTPTSTSWYEGTADAVRKNMIHLLNHAFKYLIILSGDQLYRMDCRRFLSHHIANEAEVSVATTPVGEESAAGFGIMQMNESGRIERFEEKPADPILRKSLRLRSDWFSRLGILGDESRWLASMGIYVFNRQTLISLMRNSHTDFGKHIIPGAIKSTRCFAYIFQGYWEDVGTIRAFFEANLDLASPSPRFNLFGERQPIYTRPRFLPASRIDDSRIVASLIADGCQIKGATLKSALLGIRSIVNEKCELDHVVMMGSDSYDLSPETEKMQRPAIGIGARTRIHNAIIDKNARIGTDCLISPKGRENFDGRHFYIRDGIVIVPKNAIIPDHTID